MATPTDSGGGPIPFTRPASAAERTAIVIDAAVPDSKKVLDKLLISTVLVSAIAIGQVAVKVIPQVVTSVAPLVPPNLEWLPAALTAGAAGLSGLLMKLAKKHHIVAVTDALQVDPSLVVKEKPSQSKFYSRR